MSDIHYTVKSYGEGSQDYTSDRLASTISSQTYLLSTPKNLTTEGSVVVHHTRISMSDRAWEILDAMRVPRREFQVRDKVYYGVSKEDLVYVRSRLSSMRRVQSCASRLEALCGIFNETTLLNVVSNFVEQVKKAGGKKNLGRAKASMGYGHRAMPRAIAALQTYYVENPGEVESLTKFWNSNDNVPSGRRCPPTIVKVYSTYRQDQSVLINLEEQIKGFTNALPIGAHGMVTGPPSDPDESLMVTQSTSIPIDGTTLQRSTCSLASTQTRPSFIVKLAYGPWNLAKRKDIGRHAGRLLRLPMPSNSLLQFIGEMATENATFALGRRTYLQEKLLPYLFSGNGHESSADGLAVILGYCDLICKYPKWETLSEPGPRIFKKLRHRGLRLLESPHAR